MSADWVVLTRAEYDALAAALRNAAPGMGDDLAAQRGARDALQAAEARTAQAPDGHQLLALLTVPLDVETLVRFTTALEAIPAAVDARAGQGGPTTGIPIWYAP